MPDLLGHLSLQDIHLTLLMVARFMVLLCEPFKETKALVAAARHLSYRSNRIHRVRTRPSNGSRKPKRALSTALR